MTDSIAKPIVEDVSGNHTVTGDTLRIRCQVKSSVGVEMNFTIPGDWVKIVLMFLKNGCDCFFFLTGRQGSKTEFKKGK